MRTKKGFKCFTAVLLVVTLLCAMSVSAFAAEVPATDVETTEVSSLELDNLDVEVSPRVTERSTTYLVNQAGITQGNYSVRFLSPDQYDATVTLIVNLKYMDGHTGYVTVNAGPYSYRVPVDGTARVMARNLTFGPTLYYVTITGVESEMFYSVKLYDTGY